MNTMATSFGFEQPWALSLLLIIPVAVLLIRRRPRTAVVHSQVATLGAVAKASDQLLARAPEVLRACTVAALIIALAGPRSNRPLIDVGIEGIDIALVLDVSSSMLAEDFHPRNRLTVARDKAAKFVENRERDRIAVVAFSGEALTLVPLTSDRAVVVRALRETGVGMLEDGTAIGTAIATAANRLRAAPGERVMVLLTDGVNNRGEIDPLSAARAAAAYGIRIYGIGVGTEGRARTPVEQLADGGLRYADVPVQIDEDLLRDIAALTGGRYYRAMHPAALDSIYSEIDRLETTTVAEPRAMEQRSLRLLFLLLAGSFLVAEWLLRGSRWGRLP